MEMDSVSLKKTARIAGFWYLVWSITGMYSMFYVPPKIIVPGDAAATGNNMLAHEFLFRTHIVNDLVNTAITVILVFALYRLFKQVDEHKAKLMVAFLIVLAPAVFIIAAFNIASLLIFKGEVLKSFEVVQRQDVAMLLLKVNNYATMAFILFWGLWLFPLARLVYKSRFLPRFLGVWLAINGVAYLAQSFTVLLLPHYKDIVFNISWPAMLGELAFMLWLAIMGAKDQQLNEEISTLGA